MGSKPYRRTVIDVGFCPPKSVELRIDPERTRALQEVGGRLASAFVVVDDCDCPRGEVVAYSEQEAVDCIASELLAKDRFVSSMLELGL